MTEFHMRHAITNLPAQATNLIGRQAEIAALKERFPTTRMVTLTGAGGSGKTRLALQVADELLPARSDGVWLVELASLTDPDLVPAVVSSTLGLHEQRDRSPMQVLAEHLQSKQMLLVLDNCEHLVQACAVLADSLLRAGTELWIMTTSREALGIPGEVLFPVPPLRLPDPDRLPRLERVREYEAIQLFVDRTVVTMPTFTLTAENAPTIARICRRLDGMPLAIELAAAMVRVLSVDEIDARLDSRFSLLTVGSRTAPRRQKTLRDAVDWSHDLLSEAERVLWRRLSVFAGGFTLSAAEAACAGDDLPPDRILVLLCGLVDKSVVIAEEHGGERRFRLLETIRQYGLEKLREAGEEAEVCERHCQWLLGIAEQVAGQQWGRQRNQGYGRFDRELDNLRLALDWYQSVLDGAPKWVRLGWALAHYWDARGHLREGRERVAALLAAGIPLEPDVEASALTLSAYLALMHGDFKAVVPPAEAALAISWKLGRQQGIARSLLCLGVAAHHGNDLGRAVALLENSLTICRKVNADPDLRLALYFLAEARASQGDLKRARILHEESLAISRTAGGPLVPTSLLRLARLAALEGDKVRAAALRREGLSLWDPSFKRGVAMTLADMAVAAADSGDQERFVCLAGAADAIWCSLNGLRPRAWPEADESAASRPSGRSTGLTSDGVSLAGAERALAEARSHLGAQAFAKAWARGQSLTPEAAIAYALSQLDAPPSPDASGPLNLH